jgi:hypothetical protein
MRPRETTLLQVVSERAALPTSQCTSTRLALRGWKVSLPLSGPQTRVYIDRQPPFFDVQSIMMVISAQPGKGWGVDALPFSLYCLLDTG